MAIAPINGSTPGTTHLAANSQKPDSIVVPSVKKIDADRGHASKASLFWVTKMIKKKLLYQLFLIGMYLTVSPLLGRDHDFRVADYNGKPTPLTTVEIYAHRGGRGLVPENTLYAYESALRLGVDYLDFDIAMTKDGILVVTHDFTLNPDITCDAEGHFITRSIAIQDLTYDELVVYNVGQVKPKSEYSLYFPMQVQVPQVKIPTLKEAVEHVQSIDKGGVGFQIEIKIDPSLSASPEMFAESLYQILQETDIIERTEVQSFDFSCLSALQHLDSRIKTAYLTLSTDSTQQQDRDSFPKMVKELGGSCWEPFEMEVTRAQIDEAHNLGLKVVVWGYPKMEGTEFNYSRIVELIAWGVDGIITDRPDQLRGVLSARGYNLPNGVSLLNASLI